MPSGITQGCGLGVVFQQPARLPRTFDCHCYGVTQITPLRARAHGVKRVLSWIVDRMDASGLDQIARELCDLLQCQIEALAGRKFDDFTETELDAYERRKRRILELRAELQKFVKPT